MNIAEIKEPLVYDIDYKGGISQQGNLRQVWNEEALQNSVKMWIASFEGDIIGNPGRGGYITGLLAQPMRDVDIEDFEDAMKDGFEDDFEPFARIRSLNITPNYEKRRFEIDLVITAPDLKMTTGLKEFIRGG